MYLKEMCVKCPAGDKRDLKCFMSWLNNFGTTTTLLEKIRGFVSYVLVIEEVSSLVNPSASILTEIFLYPIVVSFAIVLKFSFSLSFFH